MNKKKNVYDYIFPSPLSSYTEKNPGLLVIKTKTAKIPCMFLPINRKDGSRTMNTLRQICLYYHGNGEDIGHNFILISQIQEKIKVDVLAIEYPGYGTYKSEKSIVKIKQNSLEIYDYLTQVIKYPENNIIVMGRSLGSGPAVYLASKRNIAALIIISGFSSLMRFIQEIFPEFEDFQFKTAEENFDNLQEIENVKNPICLIHGMKDNLIRCEHAKRIEEKLKERKDLACFYREFMTHNNFDVEGDICESIEQFFKKIKFEIK